MIQYEIKGEMVEWTVLPLLEEIRFIFTKEYFEVLGFEDVSVDSQGAEAEPKEGTDAQGQTGGGRDNSQVKGVAGIILGLLGNIGKKAENVWKPLRKKSQSGNTVSLPVSTNKTNKTAVEFQVETGPIEAPVDAEPASAQPTDKERELEQKIAELQAKLQEFQGQNKDVLEGENKVEFSEDLLREEPAAPAAVKEPTVAKTLENYAESAIQSVSNMRSTDITRDIFQQPLPPIKIRFRFFNQYDRVSGLSGIVDEKTFDEAMAKQLANKANIEVSEATSGRTIQQRTKEQEDEAEQWMTKRKILNALDPQKRGELITKYRSEKSGNSTENTLSSFFQKTYMSGKEEEHDKQEEKKTVYEVFYLFAKGQDQVMTRLDFRLFQKEEL